MDSQAQLVVRDQDNNYLLLETPSKKLLLPSTRVGQDEDFHTAALRYITEVLRYTGTVTRACLSSPLILHPLCAEAVPELQHSGGSQGPAPNREGDQRDTKTECYLRGRETIRETQLGFTKPHPTMAGPFRAKNSLFLCA